MSTENSAVTRTDTIRRLNDEFRTSFRGGKVVATPGVLERPDVNAILERVKAFTAFNQNNDSWGEHDFGAIEVGPDTIFFKIDSYDRQLEMGSPDPADPSVTTRVLTIMLASEY